MRIFANKRHHKVILGFWIPKQIYAKFFFAIVLSILLMLISTVQQHTLTKKPTRIKHVVKKQSIIQVQQVYAAKITPTVTPTTIPTPQLTDWEQFQQTARDVAVQYGFPAKVIIAQAALESAHGTSYLALNRNNYFGIGAYDWNPNNAYYFNTQTDCITYYINLIAKNFPEAFASRANPYSLVYLLEHNSLGLRYASDPSYEAKVENMPEWGQN